MNGLRIPRLLPVTIFVMAALLGVKCAGLIGAASAESQVPPAPARDAGGLAQPAPAPPPAQEHVPTPVAAPSAASGAKQEDVAGRSQDIAAKEAALRQRQSVVAAAEQKLEQRVAELKALQARLEELQSKYAKDQDQHWENLVQLYERMKPREAARILEGMDVPVVVGLIDRMKEIRAAPILAAMQPDRARDITAELAARHGQNPTSPSN